MEISLNLLNTYLKWLNNDPGSIQNPSTMRKFIGNDINFRFHETLGIYLFENYGFETFQNLDQVGKQNAIISSGILFVEDSYNYIQFKRDYIDNNFFNVDATIIFRNNNRHFLFQNENYRIYTIEQNSWIDVNENLFTQNLAECNILYKIVENVTNKVSYVLFIDTNYEQDINIVTFVQEKITYSLNLLQNMLGTHRINRLSMSFSFMNSIEHELIVLPIYFDTVKRFLSINEYLNCIKLIDMGNDFSNYFDQNQNYNFE